MARSGEDRAPERRTKGARRREEILDAAREMLLAAGMGSLVLREIAVKLGMTHSNVQYYFRTTNDLLLATFEREVAAYITAAQVSVDAAHGAREQVAALLESGVEQSRQPETALWRMALSMVDHNVEIAAVLATVNAEYRRVVSEHLARIAPGLPEPRRARIARLVQAFQDGLAAQIVLDGLSHAELGEVTAEMTEVVLGMLMERASSDGR